MKTTSDTAATLRALIRWTTGTVVAAAIIAGACYFFPILSSFPAFGLTVCLSLFIGLNIALPPVDPEDDWVPIRSKVLEEPVEEAVKIAEAKTKPVKKPARTEPVPGIEVLPIHVRRLSGAPTGSWHLARPGLKQNEEAHKITLSHRRGSNGDRPDKRHREQFPSHKTG